ncbi:hypothetical protein P606_25170 [Comamonas thiooxydans]|nr:hypothetical protein P606_25170 [Comamonas thiooxydans]
MQPDHLDTVLVPDIGFSGCIYKDGFDGWGAATSKFFMHIQGFPRSKIAVFQPVLQARNKALHLLTVKVHTCIQPNCIW